MTERKRIAQEVKRRIEARYGKVLEIHLVGSRAEGKASLDSDWDFVIVTKAWKRHHFLPHRLPPFEVDGQVVDVTLVSKVPLSGIRLARGPVRVRRHRRRR